MLTDEVERYLELRWSLGFKLRHTARNLRRFARFADDKGDTHLKAAHGRSNGRPRRAHARQRGLLAAATP